jgi:hypothetical protein
VSAPARVIAEGRSVRGRTPPRGPSSLLERLVVEGVIDSCIADELNTLFRNLPTKRCSADVTHAEFNLLAYLLTAVMGPKCPSSRRAHERDLWIAYELAYYKSLGDPAAASKIADMWGVTVRTVERAAVRFPMQLPATNRRSATLREQFKAARVAFVNPEKKPRH